MVDIGAEGRKSDSGVFKNSELGRSFEQKLLNIPQITNDLPYVLVADEAFPLTQYMMRPYPRRGNLNLRQKVFNYRLSRARRMVESSFGILASMWRIFRKPIIAGEDTVKKIVQACVCLHNLLLMKRQSNFNRQGVQNYRDVNCSTQQVQGLVEIQRCGSNMYTREAALLRERFTDYFCGIGAIQWQWQKALENDF